MLSPSGQQSADPRRQVHSGPDAVSALAAAPQPSRRRAQPSSARSPMDDIPSGGRLREAFRCQQSRRQPARVRRARAHQDDRRCRRARHVRGRLDVSARMPGPSGRGVRLYTTRTARPSIRRCNVFSNDGNAEVIIGSGNLTRGGLVENYEASIVLALNLADRDDRALFTEVEAVLNAYVDRGPGTAVELTPETLERLTADGYVVREAEMRLLTRRPPAAIQEYGVPAPGGQLFPHVPVPAPPAVPVIAGGDPPRAGAGGRHGLEASRAVARRASRADSTSRPIASRGSGCRNERHRAGAPLSTPSAYPPLRRAAPVGSCAPLVSHAVGPAPRSRVAHSERAVLIPAGTTQAVSPTFPARFRVPLASPRDSDTAVPRRARRRPRRRLPGHCRPTSSPDRFEHSYGGIVPGSGAHSSRVTRRLHGRDPVEEVPLFSGTAERAARATHATRRRKQYWQDLVPGNDPGPVGRCPQAGSKLQGGPVRSWQLR